MSARPSIVISNCPLLESLGAFEDVVLLGLGNYEQPTECSISFSIDGLLGSCFRKTAQGFWKTAQGSGKIIMKG